ncbi:hypothetical protein COO60DRAFT_1667179 [Scenedesmus sp. NREL 46B-D3]|nr:hypothetical protein COO60DRAFT_1667179 [Scenedesmus sp. NREL 46B-D3]
MGPDDDDSEDEMGPAQHKAKPRRKSHQRPQGSDQIRQAFSKRKKGLVLKAYQLNALTDAKVFMFITNDKGTSWAYATPGFSNSLDPDLLKQLRSLAHVPDSAKLITEVMPDPANAKQPTDTAAAAEHAAARRDDQVPGGVLCMRTAMAAVAARSRSSYSGDGLQASALSERAPLAPSGSTTISTPAQPLVQVRALCRNAANAGSRLRKKAEELLHAKQQHARPPSGSSMAGGARPGSAAAAYSLQQQRGQGGKLLGMEPATPCGMYNLMGQPAVASDSPTVVSDMGASSASPSSSKQQSLPLDVAAGMRLAAVVNAAAANGMAIAISQGGNEGWQQQQQQQQQQLQPASLQCGHQQELQQQAADNWQHIACQQQQGQQYAQQQQQQQYQQAGDGWVAVEVSQHCYGAAAGADGDSRCQLRMCSTGYPGPIAGNAASAVVAAPATWAPALQHFADNQQHQQQSDQMLSSSAPHSTDGTAGCNFEHMLRDLPPLRVKQQAAAAAAGAAADWRGADGTHSAPAGAGATTGDVSMPSRWLECEPKPENLRQMRDEGCYPNSSGYSSYAASPSCNAYPQLQRANVSSAADKQAGSPAVGAVAGGPSSAAASLLLARDAASADASPTAALSSQLCSLLAMGSPMHEGPAAADDQQQQQQLAGWQEQSAPDALARSQGQVVHEASQQQQQQHHDQGTYIPLTDDLVSDPLMEMLMDQALAGASRSRPGSSGEQQQQHMSIMEATLQQDQQHLQHQQLPRVQVQYYGGTTQQQQQQQQVGQYSQPPYSQMLQVQHSMPTPTSRGAGLQQQQQQLLQLSGLLQHFPLPPKSDAEKPAWQEHVRHVLLSLQLQPEQQQQLMALIRDREQQALLARGGSTAGGCGGSTSCSPVPPLSSCSSAGMMMMIRPQQQQQMMMMMPGAGQCGASNAGVTYSPRGAGSVCGQQGGGKQRHGPSRLSATSPAIDAAAAGLDAVGMPYGVQGSMLAYVGQAGLGSAGMHPQQLQQQQQLGATEAAPMPANCMPMSVPMLVPMSLAPVCDGYGIQPALQQEQQQQQQVYDNGGMASAFGHGCMPQVMPLPGSSNNAMAAMQPPVSFQQQQQQQQQQQALAGVAAGSGSPHAFAVQQARQASPAASDPGAAAVASPAGSVKQHQQPASSAPGSLVAGLQQQHQPCTGTAACSSPLKRSQPCSGPFGVAAASAAVFAQVTGEAMSPMKRACREVPEPSSFATLLQTEPGEDDAVAWAASAAANDSLKMAGSKSCRSFLKFNSLRKVASGPLPMYVAPEGSEAAAAQMAAGYAAAAAAGGCGDVQVCEYEAVGGEAEDDGSMLQAVLEASGADGDGCLLDGCDTEMGDAAAAAVQTLAAAFAPDSQQLVVDAGAVAAEAGV